MDKWGAFVVGGVVLAVLVFALWYEKRHPPEIVSTARITVESKVRSGPPMTLETRVVKIGTTRIEEVRLPNGTWIGCAGDCRKAALDAGPDFWDAQARR